VHRNDSSAKLPDSKGAARRARLRYVSSDSSGIRRVRQGRGFRYERPDGSLVRDQQELARIRALAIPPAWKDVWICSRVTGHLQATGRDARGRKQYRYHPRWRQVRDEAKFHDMLAFARMLPQLRRAIARDLLASRLTKEKVVATVIDIMGRTAIRVGNDSYADANGSYGLTTLRVRHANIRGAALELKFRGKSKQHQQAILSDARLVRIIRRCRDLPGQRLFQYQDDEDKVHAVTSADVNSYLGRVTGGPFTSKTFRTWSATVLALDLLAAESLPASERALRSTVTRAIERVAARLGNTPAVCRKSYVHPAVLEAFSAGRLREFAQRGRRHANRRRYGLRADERAAMALLRHRAPRS
jgi:DNA topoisomerase-1